MLKCLVVDDEALAREVIELYISKVSFLELAGSCNSALQAFAMLNKETIDLMFLDIKMPEMTGLELLQNLKHPPKVIITTAFHQYALEGYELNVVDYLMKPVSFERFLKAVGKAAPVTGTGEDKATNISDSRQDLFVKSDRKLIRIQAADILYIEGLKNYLCIHTSAQKIIVHSTMTGMEEELRLHPFISRVHKSFLVNKNYIRELDGNLITLNTGATVPVGGV